MNIPLLKKVRAAILKHPDQFEMEWYFQKELLIGEDDIPAGGCGTAACIAGWILFYAKNCTTLEQANQLFYTLAEATAAAGLDDIAKQRNSLSCLFAVDDWPEPFSSRYVNATTLQGRAQAAADRIDHFIATKGAE